MDQETGFSKRIGHATALGKPVNLGFDTVARLRGGRADRFVKMMPSFRHLLRNHTPLLLIDASSTRVQVGLLNTETSANWITLDGEAGLAIFQAVERLGVDLAAVRAFAFCEGPGSILGVRTAAMA